jgi:hypothetical protein
MSARLIIHRLAEMIVVLARIAAAVENGRAGQFGIPACDNANRLARRVHIGKT